MRNLAIRMNPTIDPRFDPRVMITDDNTVNFYKDLALAILLCPGLKSLTLEVMHETLFKQEADGELSLHQGTVDWFLLQKLERNLKWGWRHTRDRSFAKGEELDITFLKHGQMHCFFPKGWKENPWIYL